MKTDKHDIRSCDELCAATHHCDVCVSPCPVYDKLTCDDCIHLRVKKDSDPEIPDLVYCEKYPHIRLMYGSECSDFACAEQENILDRASKRQARFVANLKAEVRELRQQLEDLKFAKGMVDNYHQTDLPL